MQQHRLRLPVSYSPPEFILSEHALSEHTTVAYPIFKETASAQCSSNRSSPPLKSVLPKHTSAVPPTLNNDATARSTSGQPPSSHTEPALSEHILAAHPIKDDSSSQDTSDQSSSSSSAPSSPSSPEPTHPEPTSAEHQRSEDNVGAQGTSDQSSSSSSSSPPPNASFAQPASAAHSGSEDDASTQGTSVRSCSPSEHTVSEDESVAHSTSADNGSNQSTPWRSSSFPEHIISEHKPSKSTASTKGNSPSPSYLHFRADYSGPSNIGLFFPFLRRATLDTPNHKACYVSFIPRPGKKPSCLFVVSTPEGRTKKQLTDHDIRAGCSASGLPAAKRVSKNMYTMSFPSQTVADISQMSAVIKLPSSTGGTVLLDAYDHRPYPSRIFSCDAEAFEVNHTSVAARVRNALHGPKAGPRASYELLRQQSSDPHNRATRYILRFDYGFRPPCTPWLQCLYIPLKSGIGARKVMVWGVFTPEDTSAPCSLCDRQCQRGFTSTCPFTKVIGSQRDD
jgi:hypothetical protein